MTASSAGSPPKPVPVPGPAGARPATSGGCLFAAAGSGAGPSSVFQQVKQTQSSLARLSRAQLHNSGQASSQTNQSSQANQQIGPSTSNNNNKADSSAPGAKSNTFVDCLNRRFRDCFSEDFCTVPMFVVGNLSPGSDGTHLILPPCVSLGGQNISRFASPKNMRLMNSIRDSCRSIEELDLGGNKLTDLIEVFKILQCTPNLKFLNLSENDLSKSWPVAMASTGNNCSGNVQNISTAPYLGHWSASSVALNTSGRGCLAPITQNLQQHQQPLGARRHSTLGQRLANSAAATSGSKATQKTTPIKSCEVRRLASAALAQSKKTSPMVATKLTSSVAAAHAIKSSSERPGAQATGSGRLAAPTKQRATSGNSTMQLARSLSSLSAKEVRAATSCSSISRLQSQLRASGNRHKDWAGSLRRSSVSASDCDSTPLQQASSANLARERREKAAELAKQTRTGSKTGKQTGGQKLFAEPIAETDHDVDMSDNQPANQKALVCTGTSRHNNSVATSSGNGNFRRTFESLKALALNNTGCQWKVVCSILNRMPNLEELHLSLNNYERIDLDPVEFRHNSLKRLYLCNNPKLTNWQELSKLLLAFPSLEALSIADCSISQIPENLDRAREWRKLCGLNINGWPIKEWPVIDRLNQLPSLVDLKCRNLDILNSIEEPRHHLIARLPKLQRLNGSEIEEREHAEKAFLRFFMANSHLERPSRFHELVQIHGEVIPVDVDVDLSPPSQASIKVVHFNRNYFMKENEDDIMMSEDFLNKLLDHNNLDAPGQLELQAGNNQLDSMDVDSSNKSTRLFKDEAQEVVAIEVDLRQSVRKFKSTLAQLFSLNSQNLILYYIDHEMVGLMGPELIKHNQKKLWNYNVQDGDQFIVEER